MIIFDMYGVILKESKGNFIPYTYSFFPETDKKFLVSLFSKAGLGEITSNEFLSGLGFSDTEFHMKDYIENHLTIDSGFYTFADKIKSSSSFTLLSNDVYEWNKYIMSYYGLNKYFSHRIVSADVHIRKPDKAIYEITLSRIGLPPNDCVFIDNSVRNLLTAREIGMDTILFNRDGEDYDGKIVNSFEELALMLNL